MHCVQTSNFSSKRNHLQEAIRLLFITTILKLLQEHGANLPSYQILNTSPAATSHPFSLPRTCSTKYSSRFFPHKFSKNMDKILNAKINIIANAFSENEKKPRGERNVADEEAGRSRRATITAAVARLVVRLPPGRTAAAASATMPPHKTCFHLHQLNRKFKLQKP